MGKIKQQKLFLHKNKSSTVASVSWKEWELRRNIDSSFQEHPKHSEHHILQSSSQSVSSIFSSASHRKQLNHYCYKLMPIKFFPIKLPTVCWSSWYPSISNFSISVHFKSFSALLTGDIEVILFYYTLSEQPSHGQLLH